ncbi:alpha/beta fold hydrolase [Xenophilus arseniciresistens]|uniref:Alpha/beta fold hydrolase n=1 Tax=Xenophilus arseniciresistens TaxID=1283306 RepID=A0AAE3N8W0_9BURK|nr:alpha/beta fold hydrolase [Xenophilus arseniciresistens]MDA7415439.1 alpha/beta fold hydrolase [Xenophilus arseniciresistens]
MKVQANGISLEVEDSGGSGPAVLLVMGLGMQLIAWPEAFVQGLAGAGYRVLRHDNRDVGLSQYFDELPTPGLMWQALRQKMGLPVRAPYGLDDMARDALGLLDALGIEQAHVIGASMGGMIAQRMAIAEPTRVRSLVSVMSSSGARGLPEARQDVGLALLSRPPRQGGQAALVEHSLSLVRLIASPGYPFDEAATRERLAAALDRAYHPAGLVRQILAIGADTGVRDALLPRISSPTLVLHGDGDVLVPIECGRDTARRIPGARFEAIAGMGHDLPAGLLPVLLSHILPFFQAVDAGNPP